MKQEHLNLLKKHWLIACKSKDLRKNQVKQILLADIPVALFRSQNYLAALLDICPHRNAPLSKGSVAEDQIQCPYHGWSFSKNGDCQNIPGLCKKDDIKEKMKVKAFECVEKLGFIWIKLEKSNHEIFEPCFIENKNYHSFYLESKIEARFLNIVENFLDPFHTHYIHNGIIRKKNSKRKEVDVKITSTDYQVEVSYSNEEKQSGFISQLFEKKRELSIARFKIPNIMQLEYFSKKETTEMLITVFISPLKNDKYKIYTLSSFKANKFIGSMAEFALKLLFEIAIEQDINILKLQKENIDQFGKELFRSTELDLVRSRVVSLLEGKEKEMDSRIKIEI